MEIPAQSYLDIAGVMLLALNPRQEVVLLNPKVCEILGYSKEEILGKRWCNTFIPAPERERINLVFEQLISGNIEGVEHVENPVLTKSGKERLIAWHNTVLRDESGRIVATLSSGEDITERRRAEEELRKAEQKYRNIFNEALKGIYQISEGRMVAANPALARILGYDSPEDVVTSVTDTAHQMWTDPEERLRVVRLVEDGQIVRDYECQFVRKDGTKIWALLNSRKVEGPDGKTLYYEGFIEDITERRRAEENRSLLASVVESSEDFIIAKDLNGIVLSWNRAAERMYGWTAEEVLGKPLKFLFPPEGAGELEQILSKIKRGESIEHYETERVRKDGTRIAVSLSVSPLRDSNGAITGACTIARDITDRNRAKEELERSFEQLRALAARLQRVREEERTMVAREIHDELGQALTAIKIELASLMAELSPNRKRTRGRADSILNLVDETIHVVRRISTELRPGILDDLGLVAALEWAAEEFTTRTGTELRMDVPQQDIAIDRERSTALFRIFQETLTNIARHAHATEVDVRLANENGVLVLEVRDNGSGFTPERLSAGASLGILGMRERAVLLGGDLTIASGSGGGTAVRTQIPFTPLSRSADTPLPT